MERNLFTFNQMSLTSTAWFANYSIEELKCFIVVNPQTMPVYITIQSFNKD